jgi:hypothetical protein
MQPQKTVWDNQNRFDATFGREFHRWSTLEIIILKDFGLEKRFHLEPKTSCQPLRAEHEGIPKALGAASARLETRIRH